jgi:hypothetical protein
MQSKIKSNKIKNLPTIQHSGDITLVDTTVANEWLHQGNPKVKSNSNAAQSKKRYR